VFRFQIEGQGEVGKGEKKKKRSPSVSSFENNLMASSSNWCIGGCWVTWAMQNKEILFLVVYVYACYFILVFVVGCSLPSSHHFFLRIYSKVLLLET